VTITTLDGLIAAMRPPTGFYKASQTSEGAGTWHSLWKAAGYPGAGSNPPAFSAGSGYIPSEATAGAIPFVDPAASGYLARLGASGATIGTLVLYDRVWACSGFGTVVTTLQSVTTPGTVNRDANNASLGDGVEAWLEVYTAPGATAATWTVTYTNEVGTGGRTATYAHPANAESVGQMIPLALAAGDKGVRAVASFQASVSSGTAGDIGITLLRRIAEIPLTVVNVGQVLDGVALGLPRLYANTCMALMVHCSATNTGAILGSLVTADG
jgi:hypothetical protein